MFIISIIDGNQKVVTRLTTTDLDYIGQDITRLASKMASIVSITIAPAHYDGSRTYYYGADGSRIYYSDDVI